MKLSITTLAAAVFPLAGAISGPPVQGMKVIWEDTFEGCSGCSPSEHAWNTALNINYNNEVQRYTNNNSNIQLSGGQTLQLVPRKESDGSWTSGRLESKEAFTPTRGKKLQIQGALRMGINGNKQGLWPAFWLLGDSMRHGTPWPLCGEIDIYEQINGVQTAYGTLHCQQSTGGICNEPMGRADHVDIPGDGQFHTWTLSIDRTSDNWQTETIQWLLNGEPFHTLSGSDMGDEGTWSTLAHSPLYILLNVAVGGVWPGPPNDATEDGYGSMMEVQYVTVYESL